MSSLDIFSLHNIAQKLLFLLKFYHILWRINSDEILKCLTIKATFTKETTTLVLSSLVYFLISLPRTLKEFIDLSILWILKIIYLIIWSKYIGIYQRVLLMWVNLPLKERKCNSQYESIKNILVESIKIRRSLTTFINVSS